MGGNISKEQPSKPSENTTLADSLFSEALSTTIRTLKNEVTNVDFAEKL